MGGGPEEMQNVVFLKSRERKCDFSLDFWTIRSSEFVETRSKVVLSGEGNA